MEDDKYFEDLCIEISKLIPLDLYLCKDRLGNFIFQFPVNILETSINYDSHLKNLNLNFSWHERVTDENIPNCLIEIESSLDNHCLDFKLEEYAKVKKQQISLNGDFQPTNVKIIRNDLNILLYYNKNRILRKIGSKTKIPTSKSRKFSDNGKFQSIKLYKSNTHISRDYVDFISESSNRTHQFALEEELLFKLYPHNEEYAAIQDIITLIENHGMYGTWIWDPYLRRDELISTLFYSPWDDVSLKALTVVNAKTSRFNRSFKKSLKNIIPFQKQNKNKHKENLMHEFKNMDNNYEGLNIEFRVQKEGNLHDRFIIFPGNPKQYIEPRAFSLGTSINSYGNQKHILQEILFPQRIVEEFKKEWNKGECLWKVPK